MWYKITHPFPKVWYKITHPFPKLFNGTTVKVWEWMKWFHHTVYDWWDIFIHAGIKVNHDDVIKWRRFPRYWSVVQGIHRSPVNSPHKGEWRGALIFSCLNKQLIKHSRRWWFETPPCPLWRHCNVMLEKRLLGQHHASGYSYFCGSATPLWMFKIKECIIIKRLL